MTTSASRRRARPQRVPGALQQRPWKQLTLPYRPIEVLSADQVGAIHDTALTILEEVGMKVLAPKARAYFASAGASVDESDLRVRFDRAMIADLVGKAPGEFMLRARNPAKTVRVGNGHAI